MWDGSLTSKNRKSLERIQKQCLRIIHHNLNYKQALKQLNIEEMQTRRTMLTLRFAKLKKNEGKIAHLFIKNTKVHNMKTRNFRKYNITANTDNYMISPILHMQKLLNGIMKEA